MKKIAFDIDGVFANICPILRQSIIDAFGYDIGEEPNKYIIKVPGQEHKEVNEAIYKTLQKDMFNSYPYPGTIKALRRLYEYTENDIIFVTARHPMKVKNQTEDWLKHYLGDIPFKVYFRSSRQKSSFLKKNNYDIFVEDRLSNANSIAEVISVSFLVNRSWNMDPIRELEPNVIRVDSMIEVIDRYIKSDKFNRQQKILKGK